MVESCEYRFIFISQYCVLVRREPYSGRDKLKYQIMGHNTMMYKIVKDFSQCKGVTVV
jgi:hypothetical protein